MRLISQDELFIIVNLTKNSVIYINKDDEIYIIEITNKGTRYYLAAYDSREKAITVCNRLLNQYKQYREEKLKGKLDSMVFKFPGNDEI